MSESVPLCTHVKTDGVRCGSPAVSGTMLCYHHSVVKSTLGRAPARRAAGNGQFEPIPFVFAEDRASMQLNYHLLLTAFNESRVDLRTFRLMMSLLKAMAKNLGKTGSLLDQPSDQRPAASNQKNSIQPPAVSQHETAGDVALSAAAESRRGEEDGIAELFSVSPDYGCLPSMMPRTVNRVQQERIRFEQWPAKRLGCGGRGPSYFSKFPIISSTSKLKSATPCSLI